MDYDLIVIGGGPAGLMAAGTAAADGLKVVLVEKKRQIIEVNRTCAQAFFSPGVGLGDRFYAESVNLKKAGGVDYFCCPDIGMEVPYHGPLSPSYQLVYLSPSGHAVKRYPDDRSWPWATIFSKKALLAGLVSEAGKAGADIMSGTAAFAVESDSAGVRVLVRAGSKEWWLGARAAIAADGLNSAIVEYLGLNGNRGVIGGLSKGVQWVMEEMSPEVSQEGNPCFMIAVPSLSRGMVMVGPFPEPDRGGLTSLIATSAGEEVFLGLKKLPRYSSWFRRARLVKRTAYAGQPRTAIRQPVSGSVLVTGDAAAAFETLVVGALACGYKAAKATLRQLDGKPGYEEYTKWWLKAFHFHGADYFKKLRQASGIPLVAVCNDEELDYLYLRLSDRRGDPAQLVREILDTVEQERPGLYARLTAG